MYILDSLIKRKSRVIICIILITQSTILFANEIDLLLDQAQKNGNLRLQKANKEARSHLDAAYNNYNEYSQELLSQSRNKSQEAGTSLVKNINFTKQMVENTSCKGDYRQLAPVLKNYQDSQLQSMRNDILKTDVADLIQKAKAMASSKDKAIEMSKMQATEHEKIVKEAAISSSQTWGGPGDEPVEQLNKGQLPLNISCNNSMPYIAICSVISNQWGSMVSHFTIEILKKCW